MVLGGSLCFFVFLCGSLWFLVVPCVFFIVLSGSWWFLVVLMGF